MEKLFFTSFKKSYKKVKFCNDNHLGIKYKTSFQIFGLVGSKNELRAGKHLFLGFSHPPNEGATILDNVDGCYQPIMLLKKKGITIYGNTHTFF